MNHIRYYPLFVLALSLNACHPTPTVSQPPQPLATPRPSSPPSPQPSSPTQPDPGGSPTPAPTPTALPLPNGFPDSNQSLASGDRLGWGFLLNRLDSQGNGALIWALGDPAGYYFQDFKATAAMARGRISSEGAQQWILNAQGDGLLFATESGVGIGLETTPSTLRIWQVQNFQPVGSAEIQQGARVAQHVVNDRGKGWVMIAREAESASSPESIQYQLLHLENYQIVQRDEAQAELAYGEVMDLNGNGFKVYSERDNTADILWLQNIAQFKNSGQPVLLAQNGGGFRIHAEQGEGLMTWLDRDELNRDRFWAFQRIRNYAAAERLKDQTIAPQSEAPRLMSAHLDPNGQGLVVWQKRRFTPQDIRYDLLLQGIQQGNWQEPVSIREASPLAAQSVRLGLGVGGQGLLLWSEAEEPMISTFHQDATLQHLPLDHWLPAGEITQISEPSQGKLDSWTMRLTPAGHGLIAWTQFSEPCPEEINCSLEQTVWARSVYDYRIFKSPNGL